MYVYLHDIFLPLMYNNRFMSELTYSYNEFLGLLLIYVAHVDMDFSQEEKNLIKQKIGNQAMEKVLKDFLDQGEEMLTKVGCKNIQRNDSKQAPGLDIHEMGGVRMGRDPKTSMLDKWNAFHNCKNVFVTDGACMASTSTQNPSLTFMALTARAANHAVEELKKGNI